MAYVIRVRGLSSYIRDANHAARETKRVIRGRLRRAGEIVQHDAAARFARYDAKSAAGYRTVVRVRGVAVEQSLRKTTGLRPDFGRLQMRVALEPAVEAKADQVRQELEHGLNELAHILER